MADTRKKSNENTEKEVDVLYQRLGEKWFAFSLVDDEVFFGEIPNEAILTAPEGNEPEPGRSI